MIVVGHSAWTRHSAWLLLACLDVVAAHGHLTLPPPRAPTWSASASSHGHTSPTASYRLDEPVFDLTNGPLTHNAHPYDPDTAFICHDFAAAAPATRVVAGEKLELEWTLQATHPGDCSLYLGGLWESQDSESAASFKALEGLDAPRRWVKLFDFPGCVDQAILESGTFDGTAPPQSNAWTVLMPDWLPSCDHCVLRWEWTSVQQVSNVEFYTTCVDISLDAAANATAARPALIAPVTHISGTSHLPAAAADYRRAYDGQFGIEYMPGPDVAAPLDEQDGGDDTDGDGGSDDDASFTSASASPLTPALPPSPTSPPPPQPPVVSDPAPSSPPPSPSQPLASSPSPPAPTAASSGGVSWDVGGYIENWNAMNAVSDNVDTVYYSFLTLDPAPNPDRPPQRGWNGEALYETMTLAPVLHVMAPAEPAWTNPHNWMRQKILSLMNECHHGGKRFVWAIGGWSDLTQTISDDQVPAFVNHCVELLRVGGGDGIDLDWEHLSEQASASAVAQQRAVLGKTVAALRAALDAEYGAGRMVVSVTLRYNAFFGADGQWPDNARRFPTDGEMADAMKHCSPDDIDRFNIMMYDMSAQEAFIEHHEAYFTMDDYQIVLSSAERFLPRHKIVMGFEPGRQAYTGVWEGFDMDVQVTTTMAQQGYGGVFYWALNEPSNTLDPRTPASVEHTWQGSTGANSRYLAGMARQLASTSLPPPTPPPPVITAPPPTSPIPSPTPPAQEGPSQSFMAPNSPLPSPSISAPAPPPSQTTSPHPSQHPPSGASPVPQPPQAGSEDYFAKDWSGGGALGADGEWLFNCRCKPVGYRTPFRDAQSCVEAWQGEGVCLVDVDGPLPSPSPPLQHYAEDWSLGGSLDSNGEWHHHCGCKAVSWQTSFTTAAGCEQAWRDEGGCVIQDPHADHHHQLQADNPTHDDLRGPMEQGSYGDEDRNSLQLGRSTIVGVAATGIAAVAVLVVRRRRDPDNAASTKGRRLVSVVSRASVEVPPTEVV